MNAPAVARRVLLLTYHDPQCTNYGAGQRTHFLLKALSQYAPADVVLFSEISGDNTPSHLPQELGGGRLFRIHHEPRNLLDCAWLALTSKHLSAKLAATIDFNDYDLIVCRYIIPYLKCQLPADKPLLIDFDDPVYTVPWRALRKPREIIKETTKWLNQHLTKARLTSARARRARFLFVCERDQAAFPQLTGELLSNIPAFPRQTADYSAADGKTLLFVGFMSWQPNITAVDHFLVHIWPRILAKTPSARFRIVGKTSAENLQRWNAFPNCTAEGYVDDLDAAYREAAVCIVPVLSGGGSNIKVPEACAHQRPVVASLYAFKGWNKYFAAGKDLLVGESNADFAEHCIHLLADHPYAKAIALNGHHAVSTTLSFDAFACRLKTFLASPLN
jgi:glycosyltransferase involved in cell wall biosynthesis